MECSARSPRKPIAPRYRTLHAGPELNPASCSVCARRALCDFSSATGGVLGWSNLSSSAPPCGEWLVSPAWPSLVCSDTAELMGMCVNEC